jgi:hypothetical protein
MTELPDPFETELSALRPREASSALRRHVAQRLARSSLLGGRLRWQLGVTSGLAAACLAAIVFWGVSQYARDGNNADHNPDSRRFTDQGLAGPTDISRSFVGLRDRRQALDGDEMTTFTWPISEGPLKAASTWVPCALLD